MEGRGGVDEVVIEMVGRWRGGDGDVLYESRGRNVECMKTAKEMGCSHALVLCNSISDD